MDDSGLEYKDKKNTEGNFTSEVAPRVDTFFSVNPREYPTPITPYIFIFFIYFFFIGRWKSSVNLLRPRPILV
jgi:hypothetical protein